MADDLYGDFQNNSGQPDMFSTMTGQNPLAAGGLGARPPASGWAPGGVAAAPTSQWGGVPGSQWGRPGGDTRPMTSNRSSNFNQNAAQTVFDPLNQRSNVQMQMMGPAPALQTRGDNSPEEQCTEMEHKVNQLIEESAVLAMQGDAMSALEKAKEATKSERALCKQREQLGLSEQINADLTYAVMFNLAVQFHKAGLHTEALNTFSLLVRNKQYAQSGRLRVNMGNIYIEQKKYILAIKMYRLALEEIPHAGKELHSKIMRNVGNAYVKLAQYKDAIEAYEGVMKANPEIITAFNLLLCYFALGEKENMKRTFSRMLTIKVAGVSLGGEDEEEDEEESAKGIGADKVLVTDALKTEVRNRRRQYLRLVTTSARLIAPVLDAKDWRIGFDYVIEQLRHYDTKDQSSRLASELEMCKALMFLKYKKYREAIEGLKAFEKKDKLLKAKAATNLSYLYFLEGDFDSGEKYADMSVDSDRYNAKALVNKGNFLYVRGEWEKAKQFFNDACSAEADCVEAIYNLGLANKQLGLYDEALKHFKRLQSIIDSVEVVYQIADLYDIVNDPNASEWFNRLIHRVPTDPNVLARLGLLNAKEGDEIQAFQYYLEAYRFYQVNMDVISWLGAYFVKNEVYDKAMQFFERAAQIQPHEVKWQLMVASCHRRRGEYPQAKRMYENIHRRHPDNMECLRYLMHLCQDSGLSEEAAQWSAKMRKLEGKHSLDGAHSIPDTLGEANTPTMSSAAGKDAARGDSFGAPPDGQNQSAGRGRGGDAETRGRKAEEEEDDMDLPGT